jgi:predicted O-linked N-acetylglucosamine transferase (SPINDLY family)
MKQVQPQSQAVAQLFNQGISLHQQEKLELAKTIYEQVLAKQPKHFDALHLLGVLAFQTNDHALAAELIGKAIDINPSSASAHASLGLVLQGLRRLDEALVSYDKALALKPGDAEVCNNRGNVLNDLRRLDEALVSYDKALAIKPDFEFLLGKKLNLQMHLCDWNDLTGQLYQLESALSEDSKVASPFELLGLIDNPDLQLLASKIWIENRHLASDVLGDFTQRAPDGKIRIGYYSADFHNHATSYLMAELFEAHDGQRFELYGFSYGPDRQDEMRKRVSDGLGQFIDVTQKSDREVAKISRDLGIDIAIDLKGFTKDSRTGIFAERCAPIQVSYLGYPGTMGAPYFDYIVADKTVIPQESQQFYSEKNVYLPHSYQVNDSKRKISDKVFTRHELGLPESGFVFCCFNNNFKTLPETFDGWMRLLQTVEGSVLWLLADNPTAVRNLQMEAQNRGVDPRRLVFAKRMRLEEHLAWHRLADLFIDTLPCNAHTTASDALWAGLPVLTLVGKSFAARVAASLLNAMDLPELVTKTQLQYEARAIELANEPEKLSEIKIKLYRNLKTSPLFNGEIFARHIEAAYEKMHRRHISGETLDHIYIND